jgi:hypothetical protein
MLTSLVALLLGAASPRLPPAYLECSLHRLDKCKDTNFLVVNTGFQSALTAFAGRTHGDFLGRGKEPLWAQIVEVLHGPPDTPVRLPGGDYLFTACMAHYCLDKGAVEISPRGKIISAAILSGESADPMKQVPTYMLRLDIFVRSLNSRRASREAILRWSRHAADEWRPLPNTLVKRPEVQSRMWLITPSGLSRVEATRR